jgi:hypothetical protein
MNKMSYTNYIYMNSKVFEFTKRTVIDTNIGGEIERTLNGSATVDFIGTIKEWSFLFDSIDSRQLLRLYNIYLLHTTFTLIDYDGTSYTVLWNSKKFEPIENGEEDYSVTVPLTEYQP